jgi:pimeloyl-ACP methyl ester carboxylesterase
MQDALINLSDGRTLAYTDIGERDWPCLMFFHGAPSSRLRLAYLEPQFLASGVRAVSVDRPGYGRSAPHPGRSLTSWPADVSALADALGIDSFLVAGHSSGGPYALASAALLPSRVSSAITLGGVTDMGWREAWTGFPEMERRLMSLPDEAAIYASCVQLFGEDGSRFLASSDFEFPEPDAQLYADARVAPFLTVSRVEAFRQGVRGYAQDVALQSRAWSFDPRAINAPVHVLHGALDTIIPLAHSRHTSECIPGSTLRVVPDHGHFTILGELPVLVSSISGRRAVRRQPGGG